VLRHEQAHCGNWPDNQPGVRTIGQAIADEKREKQAEAWYRQTMERQPSPRAMQEIKETGCHFGTKIVPCSSDYEPNYKGPRSLIVRNN